jgi:hydrogenase maturation protease
MRDRARCVVLGVGNCDRGDDAAGPAVARALRGRLPAGVAVIEGSGEATALIAHMEGADDAFLIDACVSGARPGTVHRVDASAAPVPERLAGLTTHGFGVAAAVELARALGQLPPRCIVYAIEGAAFETGAPLSPAAADGVSEAARRLCAEISQAE